ncbi:GNAT family N-acetyltransferase [Caenimonas koreensis DSM 17982]|uniref:GNAT family N-acetyltransferase n=1 Tax=Caenimonas koreensis DSM 17982 TaxID=1121255 RepID=A0A844AUX7_9BURK|nr:bifunctional acetate--CoA ligase family protein/GNAT family N-acetyltransferase [Caenimonas koreensis]MRD47904.1 GNAT family N-acetyltransferase [Caenimonas koreensis DSM 17982]
MSVRHLDLLFQPQSIAVIGASSREASLGAVVWRNLVQGGFAGPLWPVNAKPQTIGGIQTFADVESLPHAPDLAVICTPAATIPGIIDALGRKGTRAAIVITAGLRVPSATPGVTIEQAMLDAARPYLLRVLGPNCIGLLAPAIGLNASFAPGQALPGHLAFLTQSGALATAMLDWANERRIGFSNFVSLGDSADVDFGDLLDYLGSDSNTRAILMYVESIKHARKFMSAARAAARNKPVIVVKAGRAPDGAKAAASHTGALAGSDTVFDAAVKRAGMLRVDTLEALLDAAETLAHPQPWRGERLAILTNGGGAGVLAADALQLRGGTPAKLSQESLLALDAALPTGWSRGNPIDIIGDAPVGRYTDALKVLLAAPEVDGVLFMHAPTAIVPAPDIANACLPLMKGAGKPVIACWLGGTSVKSARETSEAQGIACYSTPERSVAAWLQLQDYQRNQQALLQLPEAARPHAASDGAAAPDPHSREKARAIVAQALRDGREWLDEVEAMALLECYRIPTVATAMARTPDEAVAAAAHLGYPVALKILSAQILHKSDVGGVVLGLRSGDEVHDAAIRMRQRVAHDVPHAHVTGYTVQKMAVASGMRELIAGISTDPVFGPVVLFGEGGTEVELRGDRSIGLPPLNDVLANDMVAHTQVGRLLKGYRGKAPADMNAVTATLLQLSAIACDLAGVVELDINPLLAGPHGVLAVDARIRVRTPALPGDGRLALRPYPSELEQSATVDGSAMLLRPIRPDDGERLKSFYAAATPDDMRLRFFLARRVVPHSELARYCQIDYDREMTFVAMDGDAIAGEVRAVCDPDNRQAEFAIQVASQWQKRGLGSVLMDKLLRYLERRGTAEVLGQCLKDNRGMAALATQKGFSVRATDDNLVHMRRVLDASQACDAPDQPR